MAENPVQEYLGLKTKEAAQRAADDLNLWSQWHEGGRTPELLEPLLKRYEPLIGRKVREWKAPAVSAPAFKAELTKHFIDAAHAFEPERGVAFNTYLQTRLQKAKRFNTKHQNIGYIPEGQSKYIGPMQIAQNELTEQLGRAPTHAELGTHIGLPEAKVTGLMQALRKDVPASDFETDPGAFGTSREADVVRLIQKRPADYLSADEVKVFQHIYGTGGARKITDTTGIAAQLNMSQPKVSRLKSSIANKIKKHI